MHLATYMAEKGLSDEDVAAAIARSRVSVSRYRRKLIRPEWETIEAIRLYTKGRVTEADWRRLSPSQRPAEVKRQKVA
jgi:transcriptional regulator with XRE-family HTH domain